MEVLKTLKKEDSIRLAKKIIKIFENPSQKLLKILGKERIEKYKKIYFKLLEMYDKGFLPSNPNYLANSELAQNIYKNKYYLKDLDGSLIEERPEHLFIRVAAFVSSVEDSEEKAIKYARIFYNLMYEGYFMPAGRVLAGAGDLLRVKTLANCFVTMIENDSLEAIYKAAYEAARTYSYGGGIGIDISVLRPKDSIVHNAAIKSTGSVSFMELYSLTTGLIGQEGRRGALILTIDIKHPDIFDFIDIKHIPNWITSQIIEELRFSGKFTENELKEIEKKITENTQVRFANISIKVSDEFMHALEEQNKYENKFLVYRKNYKGIIKSVKNVKDLNYSLGMPSKDLEKYSLEKVFESFDELKNFLKETYGIELSEEDFRDVNNRDIFGDYVVELKDKNYDIAIRQAGDFLLYFENEESGRISRLIKARDIWNKFIESNYRSAEPGIMFWNRMKKYSPSDYVGFPIVTTNPCSEVPLEDGGACNLGSINLSRFVLYPFTSDAKIDFHLLKRVVRHAIRFLDNVIEWNILLHPLEKQREASKKTRRIGLGVMGIADMFLQLLLEYDSEEAQRVLEKVIRFISNQAYITSAFLAKEKGKLEIDYEKYLQNPFAKEALSEKTRKIILKYGIRNLALLSIAPTGSISNIVKSIQFNGKIYIGVSGGIEPIFAVYYFRRTESFERNKMFRIFHSTIQAYIDMNNLSEKIQDMNLNELKNVLPKCFFKTAHTIDPFKRVEIQAIAQKYVDHSISSTINLPEDIHPEIISDLYIYAWKKGLKGVTIYREGSRFPILMEMKDKSDFEKIASKTFEIEDENGKKYKVKGDDIIIINNRMTTIYHLIKEGNIKIL
ncbi:MAG: adenosylcobalamin-dependent ribonucleoside-diphosphate reductase [Candidatus Aenigmatarchaeota archaeon]